MGDNLICRHSDVCNRTQLYSAYCRLPFLLFTIFFSIYRIVILYKNRISGNVIKIHSCILIWAITFTVGDILKIYEFLKIEYIEYYYLYPTWATNILPRIWTYIDVCTGTTITTLLFLCPYYWIKNILYFLGEVSSTQDNTQFTRNLMKGVYIYLFTSRVLMALGLLSLFFVVPENFDMVANTYTMFLGLQSLFNIFYVIYGRRYLLQNFQKLAITDKSKTNAMRSQTNSLIFISFTRLLHNITMTILAIFSQIQFRDFIEGLCIEDSKSIKFVVRYSIVISVTHFLAIFMILFLYRPQRSGEESEKRSGSSQSHLANSFLI